MRLSLLSFLYNLVYQRNTFHSRAYNKCRDERDTTRQGDETMSKTYEQFCEEARLSSISNKCYSAVVEIVNYRTGSSRMTTATGRTKLQTHSRGPEFRGINAQFYCGKSCP